ncbi:hypothetical protein GDO78_005560 [Eleutherodactylus coqui]|uniref:Uncharacterized protein n=1 Tax=Eleutherodactylus coqui TaxID=57060 RepID=A0A8J6FN48_ELECQ|nr:hypothetical protein GDO78_005560 [Eleutherodactylus coqui]
MSHMSLFHSVQFKTSLPKADNILINFLGESNDQGPNWKLMGSITNSVLRPSICKCLKKRKVEVSCVGVLFFIGGERACAEVLPDSPNL